MTARGDSIEDAFDDAESLMEKNERLEARVAELEQEKREARDLVARLCDLLDTVPAGSWDVHDEARAWLAEEA